MPLADDLGERLRELAAIGRSLGTVEDEDGLYDAVVAAALDLLGADAVTMASFDRAEGTSQVLRNHGALADWEEPRPADERYPVAIFPHLGTLLFDGSSWYGSLSASESDAERELMVALGKEYALLVPVLVAGQARGGLYAFRTVETGPFTALDLRLAESLAALVGASLRHLHDRASLRELAYRDPLTGLANRAAFDERLQELLVHPGRDPVGVILCDVNGLKPVNDRLGHAEGDKLLRDVAQLLTREITQHPDGLAARIGGDEFCLLVPGADDATLADVTARLVAAARRLPTGEGLSCGHASSERLPQDLAIGTSASRALLRLADAMQYRGKRAYHAARDGKLPDPRSGSATAGPQPIDGERVAGRDLATVALTAMAAAPPDAESRLTAVAEATASLLQVATWWVSFSDGTDLVTSRGGHLRFAEHGSELLPGRQYVGERFPLDHYPASARALRGGVFFATLDHGDEGERAFLAANGYLGILGAGVTGERTGWLLELCADALTAPLAPHEGLLRVLVQLAVEGAGPGRPPVSGTPGISAPNASR